jgi:HlyD family secretion protein
VLTVPLTRGSVVMNGDSLATIGEQPFKLRLRIPERHAVTLKVGDSICIDARQLGAEHGARGTITLIYPRIEEGRVVADAQVDRLGDYFVGDRIRVWITAGSRPGFVIPPDYVTTRFGLDYVSLRTATGIIATPVQRGGRTPDGLEILSGLRAGDVLAQP